MKIVYCIAGTYRDGGMERVLALKANWLAEHGYEVTVVTTDQLGRPSFFEMDSGIATVDLAIGYEDNNGGSFADKFIHYPGKKRKHRRRLGRVLDEIKPDVCVSMFCGEASFLPRLNDGSKKVAEVHFSRFKRLQYGRRGLFGLADRLLTWMDGRAAARYDRFVVLTDEDSVNWKISRKVDVIANPLSFIPESQAALDAPVALAVGRFSEQKAFDRMIEAWRDVAAKHPGWQLKIVGDGELKPALLKQIQNYDLQSNVSLIEPTKDILPLYLDASMYLMTSRYEGLPMVLIEAQSCGLPIVSMACKCGPRDIVSDGVNGYLVKDGDISGMADRICRLIEDERLRKSMGHKASEASHRFDTEKVMRRWDRLFKETVNEK